MKIITLYKNILKMNHINVVTGVPGSYIMPLWQELDSTFDIIVAKHESGAVFIADGYSRISKETSIVLTTAGPGITNAITGIASAYQDSIPLIIISGISSLKDKGRFQNFDSDDRGFNPVKLLKNITKKVFCPKNAKEALDAINNALEISQNGRKGPVHILLPIDLQNNEFDDNEFVSNHPVNVKINQGNINSTILDEIYKSKRPMFLAGWGVEMSSAGNKLMELSKKHKIPIVSTLKGLTACKYQKTFLGSIGHIYSDETINNIKKYNCDLLIALGSSLSFNSSPHLKNLFNNCKIIHVDIDNTQKNKYFISNYFINLDINAFLIEFSKHINKRYNTPECYFENAIKPNGIFPKCVKLLNNKNIMVIPDAGNHWIDTIFFYRFKNPQSIIINNGLATMGYAIGASIGCALYYKKTGNKKKTVCITGDGSFLMSGNEIKTALENDLNLLLIAVNNMSYGRVRHFQKENNFSTKTSDIIDLSIKTMAEGLGIKSVLCYSVNDFKEVLKYAFNYNKPMVIELIISQDEYPYFLEQ